MADELFDFEISTKPRGSVNFKTRKARFGDGYVQRVGDGLNNKAQSWAITFDGDMDEGREVTDFLDRHGGHISFLWVPPGRTEPIRVICEGYDEVPHVASQVIITATFEQDFKP